MTTLTTWMNKLNIPQIDPSQPPMTKGGGGRTAGQGGVCHHNIWSIVLDTHCSKRIFRPLDDCFIWCYYSSLDDLVWLVTLGMLSLEVPSVPVHLPPPPPHHPPHIGTSRAAKDFLLKSWHYSCGWNNGTLLFPQPYSLKITSYTIHRSLFCMFVFSPF